MVRTSSIIVSSLVEIELRTFGVFTLFGTLLPVDCLSNVVQQDFIYIAFIYILYLLGRFRRGLQRFRRRKSLSIVLNKFENMRYMAPRLLYECSRFFFSKYEKMDAKFVISILAI